MDKQKIIGIGAAVVIVGVAAAVFVSRSKSGQEIPPEAAAVIEPVADNSTVDAAETVARRAPTRGGGAGTARMDDDIVDTPADEQSDGDAPLAVKSKKRDSSRKSTSRRSRKAGRSRDEFEYEEEQAAEKKSKSKPASALRGGGA